MDPVSLENLKPGSLGGWKPGESGNPKGGSITLRQRKLMEAPCPFDSQGRSWLEALAEGGMRQALFQTAALSNLQDRHEGPVIHSAQPPSHNINIQVVTIDEKTKQLTERIIAGERTG
jgi:hypothetical protein|tara:strand:+ start:451 stop:804 length:354 start_codon:yes stop_codon:yes gene_type:complete